MAGEMISPGWLLLLLGCVVALVGFLAWLVSRPDMGNRDDEIARDFDAQAAAMQLALTAMVQSATLSRGRLEQHLGLPVYRMDQRQNAPTSTTLQ